MALACGPVLADRGNGPLTLPQQNFLPISTNRLLIAPPAQDTRSMARKPSGLTYLGKPSVLPASPDQAVLDRVPNRHPDTNYVARFAFPEFTCMCPVTGQPDFAIVMIDYVPNRWLIESKSLKLYLNSFRNHGAFHEECTVTIGKRVVKRLAPKWLRIGGYFYPRGGMPIDVFWQYGKQPKDVWVPDQGVPPYRARG